MTKRKEEGKVQSKPSDWSGKKNLLNEVPHEYF